MIEIKKLTLQRGLKVLLEKADAVINPGQRVGLIGKNGTGKSSLFALIKGEITQDGGEILIPKTWRLTSVSQETPDLDISALDYVLQGDAELQAFQTALAQAEAQNDGMKQAEYHAKLEEIDAYTAPARAAKLLTRRAYPPRQIFFRRLAYAPQPCPSTDLPCRFAAFGRTDQPLRFRNRTVAGKPSRLPALYANHHFP